MWYVWCSVEESVNSMSAIATDNGITMRLRMLLNYVPNFPVLLTRLDDRDCFA